MERPCICAGIVGLIIHYTPTYGMWYMDVEPPFRRKRFS